jgi:hypothetical protein
MDPVTGLVTLAGVSLASLAGLRLKKSTEAFETEGFEVIPYDKDRYPDNKDAQISSYPDSITNSQSRYNMFTNLINPLLNGIIPVGSSEKDIQTARKRVNTTLGSTESDYSSSDSRTLKLQEFKNKFPMRFDGNESIFTAISFCRETGKLDKPFGVVSKDGYLKFDEICGVCLSSGIDELGQRFNSQQGLLLDPNTRDQANQTREQQGLAYARTAPPLGTCTGAPDQAVFATNQTDLDRFKARLYCIQKKQIDPTHGCAVCFENDSYSYVRKEPDITSMYVVLRGKGNAIVKVKGSPIKNVTLSSSDTKVELVGAKEGNLFGVDVVSNGNSGVELFGYFEGTNSGGNSFYMPLNLLFIVDDITGSSPRKSGGFFSFTDVGVDVAKMKAGGQKPLAEQKMSLRGTIPFTFVDSDEFSAMDCPTAPFQTETASVSAFSTDQPCYAKGSGHGKYNNECLRSQILAVGCTNNGDLFKNPEILNKVNGIPQSIDKIYEKLTEIASKDGIEKDESKQCSGRIIDSPCDPFLIRPDLKFANFTSAVKCLSYLYKNQGASEKGPVQKIGPTYSGIVTYANNTKEVKKIFCLPEGDLNPDKQAIDLINIADNGYNGLKGIDAVKSYLNSQLELAVNMTRNANTDMDRKIAIKNCFGTNLSALPQAPSTAPKVVSNPCGITARYIVVRPSQIIGDAWIQIAQLVVINKDGENVAKNANTSSSGSWNSDSNPAKAVDGSMHARSFPGMYHSNTVDANTFFRIDLGKEHDITKVIYYNRADCCSNRSYGMRVQFYDKDNTFLLEKRIMGTSPSYEIPLLNPGSPVTCKVNLNPPPKPVIPNGYKSGLFTRFYTINTPNPGIDPNNTNSGWKERDKTMPVGAKSTIDIHDEHNRGDTYRQGDGYAVWARGFYIATGPETLRFRTLTDDGIFVQFNGQPVINNWTLHGPTWNDSSIINIPKAGIYPFDLRFYEWGGGAICKLEYMSSRVPNYTKDLSMDFIYSVADEAEVERLHENKLRNEAAAASLNNMFTVTGAEDLANNSVWPGDGNGAATISRAFNYSNYGKNSAGMWNPFSKNGPYYRVNFYLQPGAVVRRIRLYFTWPGDTAHIPSWFNIKDLVAPDWGFTSGYLGPKNFSTDKGLWYYDAMMTKPLTSSKIHMVFGYPSSGYQMYLIKAEFWPR